MMLIPEIAKQHEVFACTITFGVLMSSHVSFWLYVLYKVGQNLFEYFNETLPKLALIPLSDQNNQFNVYNYVFLTLLSYC